MVHISNSNILKSIYYAYFHCYKLWNNFLGQSFQQQEYFHLKTDRIMAGEQPRTSRRRLFKQSEILPVHCQYIFHNINTKNKHHIRSPNANLLLLCRWILFMCKDDLQYCFINDYRIFHCKNCIYLCIYDLFHSPLSLWHTYASIEGGWVGR